MSAHAGIGKNGNGHAPSRISARSIRNAIRESDECLFPQITLRKISFFRFIFAKMRNMVQGDPMSSLFPSGPAPSLQDETQYPLSAIAFSSAIGTALLKIHFSSKKRLILSLQRSILKDCLAVFPSLWQNRCAGISICGSALVSWCISTATGKS